MAAEEGDPSAGRIVETMDDYDPEEWKGVGMIVALRGVKAHEDPRRSAGPAGAGPQLGIARVPPKPRSRTSRTCSRASFGA